MGYQHMVTELGLLKRAQQTNKQTEIVKCWRNHLPLSADNNI